MKPTDASLTGGGRWGKVPADVLVDRRLSRPARWLFSLLCSHANKESLCRLRLERVARAEQASIRSVQTWLGELEEAGRVVRYPEPGKADVFRVIRDPTKVRAARLANAEALEARKEACTPKRPAAVEKAVEGVSEAAETRGQGGAARCTRVVQPSAPPEATVVQPGSPPSEQYRTGKVQQLSGPDLGTPARVAGDPGARQRGAGGGRRSAKHADPRQKAMLMPIEGGKPAAAEGPDPELDEVLRLIMAAVERLLSLNRDGRLTRDDIERAFREIPGDEDTPAADGAGK